MSKKRATSIIATTANGKKLTMPLPDSTKTPAQRAQDRMAEQFKNDGKPRGKK